MANDATFTKAKPGVELLTLLVAGLTYSAVPVIGFLDKPQYKGCWGKAVTATGEEDKPGIKALRLSDMRVYDFRLRRLFMNAEQWVMHYEMFIERNINNNLKPGFPGRIVPEALRRFDLAAA